MHKIPGTARSATQSNEQTNMQIHAESQTSIAQARQNAGITLVDINLHRWSNTPLKQSAPQSLMHVPARTCLT